MLCELLNCFLAVNHDLLPSSATAEDVYELLNLTEIQAISPGIIFNCSVPSEQENKSELGLLISFVNTLSSPG